MMYLGVLGRLVAIKCPVSQRLDRTSRYSFVTTLGGEVKAQAGPVGKRVWDVSTGRLTTPSDVGALMDFVNGVWGPGPFWFIPVDAPVVNMLTPNAASCDPDTLTRGSGVTLLGSPPMHLGNDGVAARSVWTDGAGTIQFGAPVPTIPGEQATASAWVLGSGSVRLSFLNANGSEVSSAISFHNTYSEPTRVSVTHTAPTSAVSARILITEGITQAARPALTWTDEIYEWGDGQGCEKAVITDTSRDVTQAWRDRSTGKWSDVSFTIQEVG